jgi:hypothetical protein
VPTLVMNAYLSVKMRTTLSACGVRDSVVRGLRAGGQSKSSS